MLMCVTCSFNCCFLLAAEVLGRNVFPFLAHGEEEVPRSILRIESFPCKRTEICITVPSREQSEDIVLKCSS